MANNNLDIHIDSIMYKRIEQQDKEIEILKNQLREVESQLNDRGGFDILRAAINEVITN